jgi:hypothetical protein
MRSALDRLKALYTLGVLFPLRALYSAEGSLFR